MKNRILLPSLVLLLAAASCQPDMKLQYAMGGGIEKEQTMPEVPDGNSMQFVIGTQEGSLRAQIGTGAHVFSSQDRVYLRSEYYSPTVDSEGNVRLDVTEVSSGKYQMFLFPKGSRYWYRPGEDIPLKNLVIPYSQFYRSTVDSLAYFPFYGEYNGTAGGSVVFKDVISAVGIILRGNARIASVHLKNKSESHLLSDNLAGVASFDPVKGFVLEEGVDFVNLNCTDGGAGVPVTSSGKTFYLVLSPGDYSKGLTLTVTGMDHKGQTFDVPAFSVNAGEVKTFSFDYAPDADLLFFEHFDNFVWGGNVQGNPASASYAPDALSSPGADRRGTEEAFSAVGITTPGSALIQANWTTVNGWSVAERPSVSMDYVRSRNIGDYTYLFRCQEYQGCVSVGAGDELRGGLQPIKEFNFGDAYFGLSLSFDICLRYGTEDKFCTQLSGSGIASRLVIDGREIALQNSLDGNNTYTHGFQNVCSIARQDIPAPSTERYENGWHHVEMEFQNLNEMSALGLWGFDTEASLKHGAFIDNIEIRYLPIQHPAKSLKVLLYNIQNGMWADQGNNFDNFVAFVNKYDPDVCIFCEAQSLWKTGEAANAAGSGASYQLFTSKAGRGSTAEVLENAQWRDLAARFGHSYHAVGGYHDDYPQVITSKYPVTTKARITSGKDADGRSTNIQHGAGHFQVTVQGETINFVSLHMWPFKYAPSVWNASAQVQEQSAANLEGYDFEKREVEAILNATTKRTDCGDNWLIMGDTNSVSPIDGDYYDSISYSRWDNEGYKWVQAHEAFRSGSFGRPLYDVLREGEGSLYTGPGRFMTSTGGAVRMDIMYGSESMRRRVCPMSLIVRDNWCNITTSAVYDPDSDSKHASLPSDHRPLLIEFDMSK